MNGTQASRGPTPLDALYVEARRVLLDALTALSRTASA
jgi:hypothetical protein